MIDVNALALEIAAARGEDDLVPVITKEIVHYEILRLLSERGFLDVLAFQGDTCLRLAYGARRYSEDLDFCAGDGFDDVDPHELAEALKDGLAEVFGLPVRVKEPTACSRDLGKITVRRWVIVINTTPARCDLPAQRIKLEIADVPFYTREPRCARNNYLELPGSYADVFVPCESVPEIAADKIVAFADNGKYIRWRDIWDLYAIRVDERDMAKVADLVRRKHTDYSCALSLGELLGRGAARVAEQALDGTFADEMTRFLPRRVVDTALRREENRTTICSEILALYEGIADELGLAEVAAESRNRFAPKQTAAHLVEEAPAWGIRGRRL